MNVHVGVIEWDSSREPSVFLGTTIAAVERAAFLELKAEADGGCLTADDCAELLRKYPPADVLEGGPIAISAWLDLLRGATTEPWFTLMPDQEVIGA